MQMIKYTVRYHYIFLWLGLLALLSPSGALAGDVYAKNGAPTYWNGRADHKVYASLWKYISNNFLVSKFRDGLAITIARPQLGAAKWKCPRPR